MTSQPEGGVLNQNPIWRGEPRFLRRVTNGTLYEVGDGEDTIKCVCGFCPCRMLEEMSTASRCCVVLHRVAHVYGNYYSMGFAYGSLLKEEMVEFFPRVWKHFEEQILPEIPEWVPDWMRNILANEGLAAGLDAMCLCEKAFSLTYTHMHTLSIYLSIFLPLSVSVSIHPSTSSF